MSGEGEEGGIPLAPLVNVITAPEDLGATEAASIDPSQMMTSPKTNTPNITNTTTSNIKSQELLKPGSPDSVKASPKGDRAGNSNTGRRPSLTGGKIAKVLPTLIYIHNFRHCIVTIPVILFSYLI